MPKYKLLLIDDNVDMLLIGKRIFGREGYDFFTARNGQEGLETAKFHKPDVIILDFILPDFNGKQFITKIATLPQYASVRNIPIILLTAKSDEISNIDEYFKLGLRAFLNKPFGHRELVNVVDNVVRISKLELSNSIPANINNGNGNGKSNGNGNGSYSAKSDRFEVNNSKQVDEEWIEDVSIANSTIASLCRQLYENDFTNLNEQQKLDILAVYNSSKRMTRLLREKVEKNDIAVS